MRAQRPRQLTPSLAGSNRRSALLAIIKKWLGRQASPCPILQILSPALFEKPPLNQLLAECETGTDTAAFPNQLNLLEKYLVLHQPCNAVSARSQARGCAAPARRRIGHTPRDGNKADARLWTRPPGGRGPAPGGVAPLGHGPTQARGTRLARGGPAATDTALQANTAARRPAVPEGTWGKLGHT